jgi:hypothetical protein
MLVAASALGQNIIAFKRFSLRATLLEMLILLGYASMVSYRLLKMFVEGRTP